jgi:hypothetical protein
MKIVGIGFFIVIYLYLSVFATCSFLGDYKSGYYMVKIHTHDFDGKPTTRQDKVYFTHWTPWGFPPDTKSFVWKFYYPLVYIDSKFVHPGSN